ncbi:PSD1 and planctomycete cytochrome C domain-containing protein [Stieleria sp. TO1_6]|uniref:PSD1 and planctomycete cytochrome C domain-containing protein n=1 Tax=Stieleria tagensis TaxID=2956795 RepID=UPI00209B0741|nr:PSD1 and planctomycete cytochrome C domain-containing protein [Stieleria tagensis]MCO8123567.1 PSD1 and planctomycete cytochrome C domain-containing protein [Stieleria tagensis]
MPHTFQFHRRSHVQSLILVILALTAIDTSFADSPGSVFAARYCVDCHGDDQAEADFRIAASDDLKIQEQREHWHRIWTKINSREMPPPDETQPDDRQRRALLDWIVETFGPFNDPSSTDHWSLKPPRQPPVPIVQAADGRSVRNPIDAFIIARLNDNQLTPSPITDRATLLRRATLDLTGLLPSVDETDAFVRAPEPLEIAFESVIDRLLLSPRYGERSAQHWLDVIRWAETVGFETNAERRDAWHYRDWVIAAFNDDLPYDQFILDQLAGDVTGADAALGFLTAGPANLPGQIGRDEQAMRQARQDELDEVVRTVSQSLFGLTVGCARCHDHKFDPISQHDYYALQAIFAGLQYGNRRLRGPQNDTWTAQIPEVRDQLDSLRNELESMRQQFQLRPALDNVQTESFPAQIADAVRMQIDATTNGTASLYEFQIWTTPTDNNPSNNIALASSGASVSASSFALANQTRHFDNLVDGSIDRRQAFPWVAAQRGPAWLEIQLPGPTSIDRITWHGGASIPLDYYVQVHDPRSGRWITVATTDDRLPRIDDRRSAAEVAIRGMNPDQTTSLYKLLARIRARESELRRLSDGPQTYAAKFAADPNETRLLHRGDPMQPRQETFAAVPVALDHSPPTNHPAHEPDRRLALADHLVQPDHPLTARVMVNRIWQQHFGVGLVKTASDFGRMGEPPSHPDLLDWLAVEFVKQEWSAKQLHRLIMSSQTYQQSSRPRSGPLRVDADTRLLWRFPPRRLDAEAIRDSVLQASGNLNRSMSGRGFDFFNQRGGLSDYQPKQTFDADGWRRMIYAHKIRMQSVDVFGAFDCPDAGQMTPRRNQSITPIQSLGLFNSPFLNRQSKFFADRLRKHSDDDLQSALQRAYSIALSRPPSAKEQDALLTLANNHGLEQACRVILNTSEFVYLR